MSNAENDKLRELFHDTLERIGVCPYCLDEIQLEPTDMCCSEVHGEEGWKGPDENFLDSEYEEQFQMWLKTRGEA